MTRTLQNRAHDGQGRTGLAPQIDGLEDRIVMSTADAAIAPPPTSEEAGVVLIRFDDPIALNESRSDVFRRLVYEQVAARTRLGVVADMGAIDFLSSSGMTALVGLQRRVEAQQGKLVLCQLQPYVLDVLRLTNLTEYFSIATDRASAIAQVLGSITQPADLPAVNVGPPAQARCL
jgi:anti-anti-sigma factor